jgi:hypothetical protein
MLLVDLPEQRHQPHRGLTSLHAMPIIQPLNASSSCLAVNAQSRATFAKAELLFAK